MDSVQCVVLACRIPGAQAAAPTVHLQVLPGCCSCACCRPTCCSPRRLPSRLSMLPYCACAPPPSKAHLLPQVTPRTYSCMTLLLRSWLGMCKVQSAVSRYGCTEPVHTTSSQQSELPLGMPTTVLSLKLSYASTHCILVALFPLLTCLLQL